VLDTAIDEMVERGVTRRRACEALGRPRASHYRAQQPPMHGPPSPRPRPRPCRALEAAEVDEIISTLTSERFCDQAPAQIWATLLDDGTYLGSISTMYRLLRERSLVRERRAQARRPPTIKPELVATAPNAVWSWDITKLAGPHKWTWFQLYVILDVYSRYAIAWLVAPRESARLAEELIADAIHRENIRDGQLSLHADRGSSMTSKTVSQLLADLGVLQSHSRPHVSNDNPYSEANFKTLKYSPRFPKRFASLAHARTFTNEFFEHYNHHHRHSGIGLHTPADVHHGRADTIRAQRQAVLDAAYRTYSHRFHQPPRAPQIPEAAWINQPQDTPLTTAHI
jgi:putative transposase